MEILAAAEVLAGWIIAVLLELRTFRELMVRQVQQDYLEILEMLYQTEHWEPLVTMVC